MALRLAELQLEHWSHTGEAALGSPPAGAAATSPAEPAASETPTGAAPEAAAAVPKRKRAVRPAPAGSAASGGDAPAASGSTAAAKAAAAAAAAAGGAAGKGLRHFSLKVCEKVEEKGDTSYEEVANELIADLAAEVAAGARLRCPRWACVRMCERVQRHGGSGLPHAGGWLWAGSRWHGCWGTVPGVPSLLLPTPASTHPQPRRHRRVGARRKEHPPPGGLRPEPACALCAASAPLRRCTAVRA